jgi:hypothetical protein
MANTSMTFRIMASLRDGSSAFFLRTRAFGAAERHGLAGSKGKLTVKKRFSDPVDYWEADRLASHLNGMLADPAYGPDYFGGIVAYFYAVKASK